MSSKEYWLSISEIDDIISERANSINNGEPINKEIFYNIYLKEPYMSKERFEKKFMENLDGADLEINIDPETRELLLTKYEMTFKSKKKGVWFMPLFFSFYALATTEKNISLEMARRLFEEIDKDIFKKFLHSKHFVMVTNTTRERYKNFLSHCLLSNPSLSEEARLWLELQ